MHKTAISWVMLIAWCSLIFFLSSLPTIETPFTIWWDVLAKKTAHFIEYAVLCLLTYRALYRTNHQYALAISIIFSIVFAISDEFHQGFIPGRHPALYDIMIDSIGTLASAWFITTYKHFALKFL